jgi:hypothetical protein
MTVAHLEAYYESSYEVPPDEIRMEFHCHGG